MGPHGPARRRSGFRWCVARGTNGNEPPHLGKAPLVAAPSDRNRGQRRRHRTQREAALIPNIAASFVKALDPLPPKAAKETEISSSPRDEGIEVTACKSALYGILCREIKRTGLSRNIGIPISVRGDAEATIGTETPEIGRVDKRGCSGSRSVYLVIKASGGGLLWTDWNGLRLIGKLSAYWEIGRIRVSCDISVSGGIHSDGEAVVNPHAP